MCDQRRVNSFIKLFLVGLFATLGLSDSINNVTNQVGSSIILPLTGNVYPKGHYSVTLDIGNPPTQYFLDVDTGGDVTWLQCDAPCQKCYPAPHPYYKPKKEDIVKCKDPLCVMLHEPENVPCEDPEEQCDYFLDYADGTSTLGVLLRDSYTFKLTNGTTIAPRLGLGCSYDQQYPEKKPPPFTDGVLGIGNGKVSIVAQLHNLGLIRNVFGHCLSTQGNGYLFMGDNVIPSGTVWTPITSQSGNKHYSVGPAEFLYDGQSTRVTVLRLVFDSGSTYTYFSSPAYNALLSQLTKTMTQNKFIPVKDPDFSVCWKGSRPYSSVSDVKNLFKTLTLSFTQLKNVQFQLSPEAYLSVSKIGNVCSGILNSESQGLKDLNIIGDISMLDKLVIYDNEKQQVGWVAANCNNKPSMS